MRVGSGCDCRHTLPGRKPLDGLEGLAYTKAMNAAKHVNLGATKTAALTAATACMDATAPAFMRTQSFALTFARHEFGAMERPYAAGGFDTEAAKAVIAEVFAAAGVA